MGFGIKKKLKYIKASIEELCFIVRHSSSRTEEYSRKDDSGFWFITKDELRTSFQVNTKTEPAGLEYVMRHEFDFLGTGLHNWGDSINWSQDVRTGYNWPRIYYKKLLHGSLTGMNGCDVKIPWELSRFQHLTLLVKAYIVTSEEQYAAEAVDQIEQWISKNPWCYGVNWTCAMEVSIRACNWIWAWQMFRDSSFWTEEFHRRFITSICQHGQFIEDNLEDKGGIRTNHYLSDVVGLFFIGTMFPGLKQAEQWKKFGLEQIIVSMDEMVYEDGVGFENSTGYHRLVTELFLYSALLAKKNKIPLPDRFIHRLELMFEYIVYCTRPDGRVPMVGDADDGRLFIFSDHYSWDRWDFRYLLAFAEKYYNRTDFKGEIKHNESAQWVSI